MRQKTLILSKSNNSATALIHRWVNVLFANKIWFMLSPLGWDRYGAGSLWCTKRSQVVNCLHLEFHPSTRPLLVCYSLSYFYPTSILLVFFVCFVELHLIIKVTYKVVSIHPIQPLWPPESIKPRSTLCCYFHFLLLVSIWKLEFHPPSPVCSLDLSEYMCISISIMR